MEENYLNALEKTKRFGQEHLLKFYNKLDEDKKENLLKDIFTIDFEQVQNLYENIEKQDKNLEDTIEPIDYINKDKLSEEEKKRYIKIGEDAIKKGEYAVVTMAGGQRNKIRS